MNNQVRYVHYSQTPLFSLNPLRRRQTASMKPNGFWFSVETKERDGWREWCLANKYNLCGLKHKTELTLDLPKFLQITCIEEFDKFHEEHKHDEGLGLGSYLRIDWNKVAKQHDGIIIAPHLLNRRLTHLWYYGWDCASGCLWRKRAILSMKSVPKRGKKPKKSLTFS